MHQFKEKSEQQRELVSAGLFFYPVLMAADVLAYRATDVPVGDDQRQHVELMRDIAERFNARFGEQLVVPEGRYPEVGARIMNLQDPESRMSTTYGSEQRTVYILDRRRSSPGRSAARSPTPGSVRRAPDKPGITNLIEVLSRSSGTSPRRRSSEFEGSGYGDFKAAVADAVVDYLAPVRERARSCGRIRLRWRPPSRRAPKESAGDRVRHARGRARRDGGRGAVVAASTAASKLTPVPVADLDLELDVFAGPFDLLMAVVLREGVNLAEVELGEVVVAYIEHLEERDELDLEAATEFLVLIAALLELKSRLLLPQEEADEEELQPEEAAEELLGADARISPLPRRRLASRRAVRRQAPLPLPSGAAAARAAPVSLEAARPVYSGDRLAQAIGGLLHCRRRRTPRTSGRPSRSSAGSASCAICSGAAESWTSTGSSVTTTRLTQASRSSRCSSCTSAARQRGSRTELFGRFGSVLGSQFSVLGMERRWRDGNAAVGADHRGAVVPGARAGLGPELVEATDATEAQERALDGLEGTFADGARGLVLRNVAGGWTLAADPSPRRPPAAPLAAEDAAAHPGAGRDARDRRLPPARLATGDLADPRRLRRVGRPDPRRARADRGVGRSRFGATIYRTTPCSSGCSASPGSTRSPTRRASIPRPRTSRTCASACRGRGAAPRSGGGRSTFPDIAGFGDHRRPSRLRALTRLSRG